MPLETDGSVRRGRVFTLRIEPEEEKKLKERMAAGIADARAKGFWEPYNYARRPESFGAYLIKMALKGSEPAATAPAGTTRRAARPKAKAKTKPKKKGRGGK